MDFVKATFFDFIEVRLHEFPRYIPKETVYYIKNSKGEMEEYKTTEATQWRDIKNYELYVKR